MTSRRRGLRLTALGIVAALVLVLAALWAAPSRGSVDVVDYYRVVDERTIVLGVVTGRGTWTRVTDVTETPSTVTVTVRSFSMPLLAGSAVGQRLELSSSASRSATEAWSTRLDTRPCGRNDRQAMTG